MRENAVTAWGIVVSTADPLKKGRITAKVPDLLGDKISNWAPPATIVDKVLKPGDKVWVHFDAGDLRNPLYTVPYDPAHGRIRTSGSALSLDGPAAAGITLNSDVHAMKSSGGYVIVYAKDFIKSSARELKTQIAPLNFDPVQAVKNAPAHLYRYRADGPGRADQLGPMREELPAIARVGDAAVSQSALVGLLWEAVRQLAHRVDALEEKLANTNEKADLNTLEKDSD